MDRRMVKPRFVFFVLACVVALCVYSSRALAQTSTTGALTGVVTDPSGAVIVGATVTATNIGTGQARTAITNANGTYRFSLLPPGDYRVRFEASGFKTTEMPSITVNVTETPLLNRTLQVGSQSQQVTVESTAEMIQTENATIGGLVGGNEVTSLPLSTRNYTQVVALSPGVVANVAQASNFGTGTQDVNVNGMSSEHNNYQMEGASIVGYVSGEAGQENTYGSIPVPNPDTIQEFKVQTGQYDATYGRNSGGNVNVVLKSGTNGFHGDAWEFNRNNFFNANDYFNKIAEAKFDEPNSPQVLKQNQFGFTLGGPVKKDKFFFFGSYQGTRQANGIVAQGYSPGVNLPAINDYADAASGVCADVRCTGNAAAYQAYLGRVFGVGGPEPQTTIGGAGPAIAADGSNISPIAIAILQAPGPKGGLNQGFYVPGAPTSCAAPCLTSIEDPATASENQYLINTDYHISSKNTFSERYFYSYVPEYSALGAVMPGSPTTEDFRSDFAVLRLTSIVTPNLVNEVQVGFLRNTTQQRDLYTLKACDVGVIPAVNNGAPCPGVPGASPDLYLMPGVTVSGIGTAGFYNAGSFSFGGNNWTDNAINEYQAGDQVSWNHGKHSIRVGFDFARNQWNWSMPANSKGGLTVRSMGDFLYGGVGVFTSLGIAFNRSTITGDSMAIRSSSPDAYFEDDIKLTSRLTVNAGIRWEYDGMPTDAQRFLTGTWTSLLSQVNTGSFFLNNPQGTLAGYVAQSNYPLNPYGLVSPTGATGVYVNTNDSLTPHGAPRDGFAPRVGLAWQPIGDRFVVRAGYGWFHDQTKISDLTKELVLSAPPRIAPVPTNLLATTDLANPFPPSFAGTACTATGGVCPREGWPARSLTAPLSMVGISPHFSMPLVQEYNLGIEYALPGGWAASIGYVGSHGIHLVSIATYPNQDLIIAGAPNTPPGMFGEAPESALPYNDGLNPVANWVTTNQGPGKAAVSANQIDRAPYLGVGPGGGLNQVDTAGDSKYNSLQVSLQHHLSHGLTFQASYTWSKLITDLAGGLSTVGTANAEAGNLLEPTLGSGYTLNTAQQYGLATYNRPQRLVVSYSYDLPYKNENGVMGKVLGGWRISGVTTVQDGLPITLSDPAGGTIYGYTTTGGTSRAELLHPVNCNALGNCQSAVPIGTSGSNEQRLNCWFAFVTTRCPGITSATAAIGAPGSEPLVGGTSSAAPGAAGGSCYGATPSFVNCGTNFGNSGIGIVNGTGQFNFDMALAKTLAITEATRLEFRAEAFNIWNHTQFNNPTSNAVNSSNFGVITSDSVPPRILQFGVKFFF